MGIPLVRDRYRSRAPGSRLAAPRRSVHHRRSARALTLL